MRDGVVIDGRYRILGAAGSGGMGNVYEAWDSARGVPVAVKTWKPGTQPDERSRARLSREALALSEVQHPAVVQYVDHGVTVDHGPFLVMSWVLGETLGTALGEGGSGLSPKDALRLTTRLAGGLAALHARGIVHRDLKPTNVLLPEKDVTRAVIVDLGIARVADASAVTSTGAHLGTPRYMAPEQIRNARWVTGKADVFALGCVLFECVTGRPAFEGSSPVSVLARILFEPFPVPSASRADLPRALDELVARLLHRDPAFRPTADEVCTLVEGIVTSIGPAALALLPITRSKATRDAEPTPLDSTPTEEGPPERSAPPSLRLGHNAVAIAARHSFPQQSGAFFGRDQERADLAALLGAETPVVTLWGAPGIGKTRLVVEVVQKLALSQGPLPWDALVFGDLSEARDADDVVRILSRQAGVSLESSPLPEIALARSLAKMGRVLIIADPVDHVAASFAAMILACRRVADDLQIIAISRERFCPPGALAVEVGPLSTAVENDRLSPTAALLVERAGRFALAAAGPLSAVDTADVERAERIVRALEGVPLAIELYAAHAPILGLSGLLARVTAASAGTETTTLDMSRGAMRNAIAGSWELLSTGERTALAECAVFRGGFDAAAAAAVVSVEGSDVPVLERLRSLREKSLLYSWVPEHAPEPRLSMFPAIREFASERHYELPSPDSVSERHAEYYATLYAEGPPAVATATVSRLEMEADNLLAAAERGCSAEGCRVSLGLRCLLALEPAMLSRGATRSFRALLDQALHRAASEPGSPGVGELAARARQIRARLDGPAGEGVRADADLRRCLEFAERTHDERWQGAIWLDLAVVHHLGRDLAGARRGYEQALALLPAGVDLYSEGRCLGNLGALSHDEGDLHAARRLYRQSITLLEEAGEIRQRANFITNLAVLEQELGDLNLAHGLYEKSIALLEPLRDARVLAIALGNLGVLELELERPVIALGLCERSLALLSGANDRRSEALALGRIATALAFLGKTDIAEIRFARGERLAGDDALLRATVSIGRVAVDLSRASDALAGGDATEGARSLHAARMAMERARTSVDGRGSVHDASDDARATLRIATRRIAQLERR